MKSNRHFAAWRVVVATTSPAPRWIALSALLFAAFPGCSSGSDEQPETANTGTGGSNVGGGASPSGGALADGFGGDSQVVGAGIGGAPGSGGTGIGGAGIGGAPGSGGAVPSGSGGAVPSGSGGDGIGGDPGVGGDLGSGGDGVGGELGSGGTGDGGTGTGGTPGEGGAPPTGDDCTIGAWAAADPSVAGPFAVATEEEVGPEAGEPDADGSMPRFTLFRPEDMDQSGLCHPVITWGNGTGSTPSMYGNLLRHFASHGFVVIGSNSTNVSRGDPKPMNVGVTWVLEQNEDPSSALYHRIDTTHIGATGHSQGAMATSQASADDRIVTSVPIEGAMVQRDLHGPAMFFCGGLDDLVGCDGARSALDAVDTLPAMYANHLASDHGSWMSWGNTRSEVETAITAWMRVHLMADAALRSWFYGASCTLCADSAWEIDRKNMDQ